MAAAADDDSDRRAAFAAARNACRREGGGGAGGAYLASFFLPRAKRDGVYAVGAFARLIRQAIEADGGCGDSCSGAGTVTPLLKSRVDAIYDAPHIELPLPQFRDESQWTLVAIRDALRRFDIPRKLWHDLVDGLVAVRGLQRVATWRSLDSHLAASGGSVGRIVAAVLGAAHSDAGNFSAAIGRAVALTSVLRDLKLDVSHDRILLPLEDLARFRYSEREMLAGTVNDNFRALIRHEVGRARELFREGVAGTCWLDGDGSRMAAAALVSLQLAVLDAIEREPDVVFRDDGALKRPSLASQLRQLPRAWRIAKRQATNATSDLR
jgi:phytoene synthase